MIKKLIKKFYLWYTGLASLANYQDMEYAYRITDKGDIHIAVLDGIAIVLNYYLTPAELDALQDYFEKGKVSKGTRTKSGYTQLKGTERQYNLGTIISIFFKEYVDVVHLSENDSVENKGIRLWKELSFKGEVRQINFIDFPLPVVEALMKEIERIVTSND